MALRSGVRHLHLGTATAPALIAALCLWPTCPGESQERKPMEEVGQPPAPEAELPTATSPARVSIQGSFVSVQANVDADGRNVVGDAANEPSLAVSPLDRGRIAIGWRQFDSIASNFRQAGVNVSLDGGRSWEAKSVLDPGVFASDPVLGAAADGTFVYSSLHSTPDFFTTMYRSLDDLASWTPDVYTYGGDKQWIAIDTRQGEGRGHVYQAWDYANCCGANWFDRSIDRGATWEAPVPLLGNPYWGTLAVAPDGGLWVAGTTDGATAFGASHSSHARNPEVTPSFDRFVSFSLGGDLVYSRPGSPNPGGLLGQIWIAIDRSQGPRRGWIYVLATVDPPGADPNDVQLIRSTDDGATWSAPVRVNDDPADNGAWQWFGALAISPDGRLDSVWNDTRNHPSAVTSELFFSSSTDGGFSWSPNAQVGEPFDPLVGWPQQNKLGDYIGLVSDRVGADVIYPATYNGEQDVYYLRVGDRDCNDNGTGDATDISAAFDTDLDADGIPDRCESDGDGDGAVDALDNCVLVPNRDQVDSDEDGFGDLCAVVFADGFETGDSGRWSLGFP
jgi:hypothetical protein